MTAIQTPIYCMEFQRWRDAPADQKAGIVRDQFMHRSKAELFLDVTGPDLPSVTAPCGKAMGDCSPSDLASMAEWYRAWLAAGKGILAEARARRALSAAGVKL
jgi:hypothetical protein